MKLKTIKYFLKAATILLLLLALTLISFSYLSGQTFTFKDKELSVQDWYSVNDLIKLKLNYSHFNPDEKWELKMRFDYPDSIPSFSFYLQDKGSKKKTEIAWISELEKAKKEIERKGYKLFKWRVALRETTEGEKVQRVETNILDVK